MKHIEQILPEYAAFELDRIGREETDATASAALSRLLHDWTGCAIPPTADTPQSEVEELVPLCLSILRRHWTTPLTALGDGTTPMSLADLLRRLIGDRVDGNEAWSIPPANANIPTAVAALLDRKIGGVPEAADGMSLVHLLFGTYADIEELTDNNEDWTMNKAFSGFPNLKKLTILGKAELSNRWFTNMSSLEELIAPNIQSYSYNIAGSDNTTMPAGISNLTSLKKLDLRGLGDAMVSGNGNQSAAVIAGCPALKEVWLGKAKGLNNHESWGLTKFFIQYCSAIEKISVEDMGERNCLVRSGQNENLVCLQIRGTQSNSCNLNWWSPTTALSERLPEFLANFKTYIAQRLTDEGSGLTLTLSQAVRDAIQTDPDIVNIITSKGWTISPAPSV